MPNLNRKSNSSKNNKAWMWNRNNLNKLNSKGRKKSNLKRRELHIIMNLKEFSKQGWTIGKMILTEQEFPHFYSNYPWLFMHKLPKIILKIFICWVIKRQAIGLSWRIISQKESSHCLEAWRINPRAKELLFVASIKLSFNLARNHAMAPQDTSLNNPIMTVKFWKLKANVWEG